MAPTDFENIGGPWEAENEPWRVRRNAQFAHRRVPSAPPARASGVCRIRQIIDASKKTMGRPSIPAREFVPHIHLELYQKDYERVYGPERAMDIIEANEAAKKDAIPPPHATPGWKPQPENYNHPAIQMLHTEFYSRCISPPIDVRLKAHKEAGYPHSYLIQMLKKHDEQIQKQPEIAEWFDRVMGPHTKKKESVPKPRTLTQIFKIRAAKAVMPDDVDDLEEGDEE